MRPSENLVAWRLLRTLAQTENLTRAAIFEDVELSAASRLVTALERDLGVALLDRSRKPLTLLPAARQLIPQIAALVDTHRQLVEACGRASQPIRLSIPTNIGRTGVLRALERYRALHPGVAFELTNNATVLDLLNGRVDAAAFPSRPAAQGLRIVPLFRGTGFLTATPAYLARFGQVSSPEALLNRRLIFRKDLHYPMTRQLFSLTESFDLATGVRRPLEAREPAPAAAPRQGDFFGDADSCLQTLLADGGIALDLSLSVLEKYLMDGRVVPVLPEWHRPPWDYVMAARERSALEPVLPDFMAWYAGFSQKESLRTYRAWFAHYGQDFDEVISRFPG